MFKGRIIAPVVLLLTLGLGIVAANGDDMDMSLYHRLGGKKAITAVVNQFVNNVGGDTRINGRFAHTNLTHLKKMLVEQICAASGGPCVYTGKSMKEAHAGMNIQDAEFNALVEDLVKALDTFKVQEKEKNDLLNILGPMKPDIVGQ